MTARLRCAVLACVVALAAAPRVEAFRLLRLDGNPCGSAQNLSWSSASAALSTDLLLAADANVVLEAADTWNQTAARFRFHSGGGNHCPTNDGTTGVAFASADCNGKSLDGLLAVTVSVFRTANGELVDGSVTFNANAPLLDNRPVFLQTALHELGHVLGLDHSDTCGDSGARTLMKTTIILSEPRLDEPQADDLQGANSIYGGSGGPTELSPTSSCAIGARPASTRLTLLLLAPALVLVVRRRTRPS